MPNPRVAHALFCDDVSQEAGNKMTFAGIYAGDMVLPAPRPWVLRSFCTVTWLVCDPDDVPAHVLVQVYAPGEKAPFASGELRTGDASLRAGAVKVVLRLVTESSAVRIADEGDIEVYVECDGMKIRAGRLAVRFA